MSDPHLDDGDVRVYLGDNRQVLAQLPDGSVDCIVTSPPYWGLRDYGVDGQIGLEASPDVWVAELVAVFRECRRVLADHGTFWLNVGDAYAGSWGAQSRGNMNGEASTNLDGTSMLSARKIEAHPIGTGTEYLKRTPGCKQKDLIGLPWMLAFALRADGWYLRSEIIWAKPNPMPESVRDRPTKAHEQVFLLTKQPRYWYDAEAIKKPSSDPGRVNGRDGRDEPEGARPPGAPARKLARLDYRERGANARSVWLIATQPFPDAHFATFPIELPSRCIKAGCPERVCTVCGQPSERIIERIDTGRTQKMADGWATHAGGHGSFHSDGREAGRADVPVMENGTVGWTDCGHNAWRPGVVLDPFHGSGTTSLAARALGRHAVGVELSREYVEISARRLQQLSLLGGAA